MIRRDDHNLTRTVKSTRPPCQCHNHLIIIQNPALPEQRRNAMIYNVFKRALSMTACTPSDDSSADHRGISGRVQRDIELKWLYLSIKSCPKN